MFVVKFCSALRNFHCILIWFEKKKYLRKKISLDAEVKIFIIEEHRYLNGKRLKHVRHFLTVPQQELLD